MKKIFTFFLAALFSVGVFADHYIAGSFTEWGDKKVAMTPIAGTTCSAATIDIQTGEWTQFKVVDGETWLGQSNASGNIESTTLTYYSLDGGENINLKSLTQGKYTFIYNYDINGDNTYSKGVSVIFPGTKIIAAGTEALFGSNWSAHDENNILTDEDGDFVYSLVKEDVELSVGLYEFKVVVDQDWDNAAYPALNQQIYIGKAGTYDVTITFNYLTKDVNVTLTPEPLPLIQIAGTMTDPAWGEGAVTMNPAKDELTASYTFEGLAAGSYEFKVINNGAWVTKSNNGKAYELNRGWTTVEGVTDDASENLKLIADKAGDYTFIWTYETNTLTIEFPAYAVNFEAPANGTLVIKNGETEITSGDKFAEGTTLTVEAEPSEGYELTALTANDTDISATKSFTIGTEAVTVVATFAAIDYTITCNTAENGSVSAPATAHYGDEVTLVVSPASGYKIYSISYNDGSDHVIEADGEGAYKFTMPAAAVTVTASFTIATAIDNTEVGAKAVKAIENGQLVIRRGGKTYSIIGAQLR